MTYDDIFSEFFFFVYIYVLGSQLVLAHMYWALCLHAVLYYFSIQHHVVVSFMIFVDPCSSLRSASQLTRALSYRSTIYARRAKLSCQSLAVHFQWAGGRHYVCACARFDDVAVRH